MTKVEQLLTMINEKAYNNADELANDIKLEIKKIFPKSWVDAKFSSSFYPSITVMFTLTPKDKSNVTRHNDPVYHDLVIDGISKDGILGDKVTVDVNIGGTINITPKPGSYLAFDKLKVGWRKKTDVPDKIVKYIGDYFKKLKQMILSNKDKMRDQDKELVDKYL